jgi:hypothetical protein
MDATTEPKSALRRWLWFIGLWVASVGTTGAVSVFIRFWLT